MLECHPTFQVVIAVEDPDVVVVENVCVDRARWETTTNDVECQRDAPGSPPCEEVYVPRAHSNADVAGNGKFDLNWNGTEKPVSIGSLPVVKRRFEEGMTSPK